MYLISRFIWYLTSQIVLWFTGGSVPSPGSPLLLLLFMFFFAQRICIGKGWLKKTYVKQQHHEWTSINFYQHLVLFSRLSSQSVFQSDPGSLDVCMSIKFWGVLVIHREAKVLVVLELIILPMFLVLSHIYCVAMGWRDVHMGRMQEWITIPTY